MKNKIIKALKWFLDSYIWLFIIFFACDIITKNLIVANLELGDKVDLIPGFLRITYSINDKAAFSIGFSEAWVNKLIYSFVAAVATIGISIFFAKRYTKLNGLIKASLMLILVGAIGNLIDRLFYSPTFLHSGSNLCGVVDWIDFYGIWDAVFNIADSCVVIACFMLIIYFIVMEVKEHKNSEAEKVEEKPILSKTEIMMKNQDNEDKK